MKDKPSNTEIYKKRLESNKTYKAFVNKDIAEIFDKKLKENNITFSNWLRQEIYKYISKNK